MPVAVLVIMSEMFSNYAGFQSHARFCFIYSHILAIKRTTARSILCQLTSTIDKSLKATAMENNCLNSVLARVTYKNANHCGQLAQFIGLISNKTPTQALTPPAEKIGKSLTYV